MWRNVSHKPNKKKKVCSADVRNRFRFVQIRLDTNLRQDSYAGPENVAIKMLGMSVCPKMWFYNILTPACC